jgi:filamentous hemagglutinin
MAFALAIVIAASSEQVGARPPPLPTPCLAASCAVSAPAASQSFVQLGAAGAAVSGTTMTITQTTSKAILNWANFNIASGYTVNFIQPSATAQVLNNIWSANETVIAGALKANGQVYLYNQNGILFSDGAQVNVGGLTATTLNFASSSLFQNGILSGAAAPLPGTLNPVFQASVDSSGNPTAGTVTVGPGAVLSSASGGRIVLLGTAVKNGGTITTPDGQTILAAGDTVYLAASNDPALRGLLIEVNANGGVGATVDSNTGEATPIGTVSNQGQITAPRGNVTLAGFVVNQAGLVSATTSVGAHGGR